MLVASDSDVVRLQSPKFRTEIKQMAETSKRYGPTAYLVGAVIAVVGVLFTLGIVAADRNAASERFDSIAASTALALESELESIVHVLHGARSLVEVRPDLSAEEFAHFFEDARPVAGVIGWGAVTAEADTYTVNLFYSPDPAIDWTGVDLSQRRDIRESITKAVTSHSLTATAFTPMTDLPRGSALLIHPHGHHGNPAFAIVNADLLAASIPPALANSVTVTLHQSTQLPPRGVAFRGMTIGFGNRPWSLNVIADNPNLYPSPLTLPLGLLVSAALALTGMIMAGGIAQRRRLRDEVSDNDRINEAREQFIASVSHEIRTPLTAVVGYSELLEQAWDDLTDDEARDMVRQISEQSMEVSALVKDLLVGSRADISSLHLDIAPVVVREVTERALASIPSDLRRNIEIGFDDDRRWLADPGRVAQIIRNLTVNALKYGGEHVSIESRRLPGVVILSVVDDGEGVAVEDIDRIFQPFSSIAKNTQALPSVGLGLYVSASLARAMGGSVNYRRQNNLTAFDLELPVAPEVMAFDYRATSAAS
jgi:signal transduction histidine kinase